MNKNVKGFTLVELAIVLVIIGLLVGGVLQGQELIKQAQLRSVVRSIAEMDTAINTFRAKYNGMPGDFTGAKKFGINHAKNDATVNLSATSDSDKNGNGDSTLDGATTGTFTAFAGEMMNFFVMLSNSELVKGSFSQAAANTAAGTAYPTLPVGTGMVALTTGGQLNYAIGISNPLSALDAAMGASGSAAGNGLTPEEANSIDTKVDDGAPQTGIARVYSAYGVLSINSKLDNFSPAVPGSGACVVPTTLDYNVSSLQKTCSLRVRASG